MKKFSCIASLIVFSTYCASVVLAEEDISPYADLIVHEEENEEESSKNNASFDLTDGSKISKDPSLFASEQKMNDPDPSFSQACEPDIQPYQIQVRHLEWEGIGYKEGYTTLQGFIAPMQWGNYIPFFDLRGHVFNNGKFAANTGLGLRYIFDSAQSMIGGNVYYDYRSTKHHHYNQIGVGAEYFFGKWEARANGYFPVGSRTQTYHKELLGSTFKAFQGNNLLINEHYKSKQEFAMIGFNAEVGVHPLEIQRNYDLYVAAGPYYFSGKGNKNAWGGMVHAKGTFWKYLSLEIGDSYDHLFHNRFHAEVAVNVPLGKRKQRSLKKGNGGQDANACFANNIMFYRASQPADRQEIVVVDKRTRHYTIDPIAIDPTTGQPFYFVFVNNTANAAAGDGTFENPFANLSTLDGANNAQDASAPGNIIYVFAGDGLNTHMSNGITLKNQQRLLGSGISNEFDTTKGIVTVPPQTTNTPTITNNGGIVVSVPTNNGFNEVSGFNIGNNLNMHGIIADTAFAGGTLISLTATRNTIQSTLGNGVGFSGYGTMLVDSNEIIGAVVSNAVGPNSIVPHSVTITNNTITAPTQNTGVFITQHDGAETTALINDNELFSTALDGIEINTDSIPIMHVSFLNNFVHNNPRNGLLMQTFNTNLIPNVSFFAEVANNTFTNNAMNGVNVNNINVSSTVCLRLINNVTTGSSVASYNLSNVSLSTLNLESVDNNVGTFTMTGVTMVSPCTCGYCP